MGGSPVGYDADTMTVTMLAALRDDFQMWLAERNLVLATVPGTVTPHTYIVVPRPKRVRTRNAD
jgi:hypothetical protein